MKNTALVLTADHGESLGEHEHYFAHGEYLYEDQIRVPLILKIPGQEPRKVEEPVALLDIYPTLLKRLGLDPPPAIRGRDLFGELEARRLILTQTNKARFITQDRKAMIWKGYKLIQSAQEGYELYDIEADPLELNDLKSQFPRRAEAMHRMLNQVFAKFRPKGKPAPSLELDEETSNLLKGLGY